MREYSQVKFEKSYTPYEEVSSKPLVHHHDDDHESPNAPAIGVLPADKSDANFVRLPESE